MKYTVHLYKAIRVKVEGVEANSQKEAMQLADAKLNMDRYLCNGAEDEECCCLGALVDEEGDEDYERSRYHEGPGAKAYHYESVKELLDEALEELE